jgi:hypothetical protein
MARSAAASRESTSNGSNSPGIERDIIIRNDDIMGAEP